MTTSAELHWQDAQCPACQAIGGIRYSLDSTRRDHTARCARCGWQLIGILAKHHRELMWARTMGESVDALLRVLATQAAPVADVPPTTFSEGRDGTYKARVVPPKGETPADRLVRLADQFGLNGGTLRKQDGYIRATSQRRGPDGSPVLEYAIGRDANGWACSCEATRFCAHLAGLWRHFCDLLADPDRRLSARGRAQCAAYVAELAAQAGVAVADVHTPMVAHDPANRITSEAVA